MYAPRGGDFPGCDGNFENRGSPNFLSGDEPIIMQYECLRDVWTGSSSVVEVCAAQGFHFYA